MVLAGGSLLLSPPSKKNSNSGCISKNILFLPLAKNQPSASFKKSAERDAGKGRLANDERKGRLRGEEQLRKDKRKEESDEM